MPLISLRLCDRIAASFDRQVAADFSGLSTMDFVNEASGMKASLWLSVFDATRGRTEHIADFALTLESVAAETYAVTLHAQALVDGDLRAEDLVKRFGRHDLSVEETIRYYTAGDAQGVAVKRRVEVFMGPLDETRGLDELEGDVFPADVAKKASEWLGVLREILASVAVNPGAPPTAG